MIHEHCLLVCATLLCSCLYAAVGQGQSNPTSNIPRTRFTCQGRGSGYYADMDTGCQVYHMCDGLGRQFSYSCPNTTLFQQRMLICDHWYMVNCSMSERDYTANLLIGQRDKPFVSDEEMRQRTPRPDILSVPPNSNYYDGLREAESKYPIHPGNSIVGVADSLSGGDNNGLDTGKQNYRPPTSWSTKKPTSSFGPTFNTKEPSSNTGSDFDRNQPSTNIGSSINTQKSDSNFGSTVNTNRPSTSSGSKFNTRRPINSFASNFDSNKDTTNFESTDGDTLAGAASQKPGPTIRPIEDVQTIDTTLTKAVPRPTPTPPSKELVPPSPPATTETNSEEFQIDARMKDPVFEFIKRFDPNSPDSHKTSMTKTEIIDINKQLPEGQVSSEEDRSPRKNKNFNNSFNKLANNDKSFTEVNRFDNVNVKTTQPSNASSVPVPDRVLLPPKTEYSQLPSTTMGPPIYYEWKWAVPAFGLEPPKVSNDTSITTDLKPRQSQGARGRSPFRDVPRPTPADIEPTPDPKNTEYNISSYFVPDYVFPLDKPHPGYESDDAQTSFQVNVGRPGRSSYGENPACPQCHPAHVKPGTCEPCIVKR